MSEQHTCVVRISTSTTFAFLDISELNICNRYKITVIRTDAFSYQRNCVRSIFQIIWRNLLALVIRGNYAQARLTLKLLKTNRPKEDSQLIWFTCLIQKWVIQSIHFKNSFLFYENSIFQLNKNNIAYLNHWNIWII